MLSVLLQTPTVPIGSYVASPTSFLHGLDARVKQLWLVVLMLLPGKCSLMGKLAFAGSLTALSVVSLPRTVWRPQLMQLALLCGLLFVFTSIGADGVPPLTIARLPPGSMEAVPLAMPPLETAYSYVVAKLGPIMAREWVTRRGLALAGSAALLTYSILLSAFLCLTTTPPEATVAALRWILAPLRVLRVDVDEVALMVLLSLRFLSLVFEEIRNLALGVAVRGVDWQALGGLGQVAAAAGLASQLFKNFFVNAAQIAGAMEARPRGPLRPPDYRNAVRGYRGTWQANAAMQYAAPFRPGWRDAVALVALAALLASVQAIFR